MEPMAIAHTLEARFPDEIIELVEYRSQVAVILQRDRVQEVCRLLHNDPAYQMNHLLALCGVDYTGMGEPWFEVVYNLYSIPLRHTLRLRARVPAEDPRIDSVTGVWEGANWLERETYDLLGIVFTGHQDLRRILLPASWDGHPLRKSYPLQTTREQGWPEYEQLKKTAAELRRFDFIADEGEKEERAIREAEHGTH